MDISKLNTDPLERLRTAPVGKLLWDYSLPAVVGMVVMALYNIIDRVFVGRVVGPEAIAGLTITFPVMNISTAVGVLIGGGSAARVSIMLGNNDSESAHRVLGNALVLTVFNAAVYLTLFGVFLDPLLEAFGASEATLPYAREFLIYIMPGLFLINITFSFNNVMRASGFPKKAMFTMLLGAGLNILLAPVFVYFLDMGIKGAAIATDISMFISAIFVMHHFFTPESTLRFKKGIFGLRWNIVIGIVSIGAAPCVVNVAACLINIIINNSLSEYGGDNAVAAAGIFTTYTAMLVSVILGICQGLQPIIGFNYGAGCLHRLKKTYWLAVAASTVVCLLGWAGALIAPEMIANAFTADIDLINVTANALTISIVCFWMVGFQIISTTFFQSIGSAGKSIILGLTRQVIFLIPLLLILRNLFGLNGIWAAFPTSDVFSTIVTAFLIFYQMRKLHRTPTPEKIY